MGGQAKQWPPLAVSRLRANLGELRGATEDAALEPETRAWLARLLVVRSVGFIEQGVVECCREHVRERSGGMVRAFAHSWLGRSKNSTPDNLSEISGRFDQSLSEEFTSFLREDNELVYRDLCFMVDRRNKIAHGLNEGIGPVRAVSLVGTAYQVVDWFTLTLNPYR